MASFPNSFVETPAILEPTLDVRGNDALIRLNERGFTVATGLSRYFAGAIGVMGQQVHIREYCPKDPTPARFGTEQSTAKWLQKGGGRAVFLLLECAMDKGIEVGQQLTGYAWTGVEACEELPNYPITSAYRLGRTGLGKGLAADFIQTVVSGTHALYAPEDGIGLETWHSNHAAGLYQKVGFELLAQKDDIRPTLDPSAISGKTEDTRLYMGFPNELFA
jgi:hypothetical protein